MPDTSAAVHEMCRPIQFLLGTWRGRGKGLYPTIESFEYEEEIRFTHLGKPFLAYSQSTRSLEDGRPLHGELGFWRPQKGGALEIVLAHPFGVAEILEGTVEGPKIDVRSTSLESTTSAKALQRTSRTFEVDGDVLVYAMSMETAGQKMQGHLTAELHRVAG